MYILCLNEIIYGIYRTMVIYELRQNIEVITPKGRGHIFLVTEYGLEIEKIFTVILKSGEIYEFKNSELRAVQNMTMGRIYQQNG